MSPTAPTVMLKGSIIASQDVPRLKHKQHAAPLSMYEDFKFVMREVSGFEGNRPRIEVTLWNNLM